ncbi:hypothetical protein IC235_20430 [Hymenobacter sp. BT664]|uniref:Uncharacterized protein n=1 Tax=Hymenobacter montanus TaxID=2771359 RepID=A0A927GL87_9BACT|nr:hypothetical protein [Hymenobacter montanus]MBD2770260.1 hypothetical protein [Hymenobacter montanus]
MALKDFDQLVTEINTAVHPNGPQGKTTALSLGTVLKSLAKELTTLPQETALAATHKADLDASGRVPASQLPSFVDDVVEAASVATLPSVGEAGKIYVVLDTNRVYRWSGTQYVAVAAGDGVQSVGGLTGVVTLAQLGLNLVDNTRDLAKPLSEATLAALAGKADTNDPRLLSIQAVVNCLAVRISTNATRTRTYYTGVGSAAAENADDGLVRALAAALPGETVQVTTPIVMPYANIYNAVLRMQPGTILDLGGFDVTTVQRQDGVGFGAGSYTVYGRNATIYSTGAGSAGFTWPDGSAPTIRTYEVHLVNTGTASAILMRSGNLFHRGSVVVNSDTTGAIGVNLYSQAARYELVGDITVSKACWGMALVEGCEGLMRGGRFVMTTPTACLATLYNGGKLELMQCVVDVTAGPTTSGARLQSATATLVLTDVTVLGGSVVANSTTGRVVLRGSTVLPAAYGADYLRGLGLTVVDERPATGVAHRSGTVLTFEQNAEYDPISTGTFSVDDSTKRIGTVVTAYLTPTATAPTLSAPRFQSKDSFVAGKNLMYHFKVGANGSIQYTITVLD